MRGTKETRRNNKGITLIALIITIIVMLILVAVTITVSVNGGLFEYAGRAGRETEQEKQKEQELATGRIQIGEIWYDSMTDYLNGIESTDQGEETFSEYYTKGQLYTDKNGKTAWIPKNYAVGTSYGINTIDKGLVVKDINGNEYVWIPVEDGILSKTMLYSGIELNTFLENMENNAYSTEEFLEIAFQEGYKKDFETQETQWLCECAEYMISLCERSEALGDNNVYIKINNLDVFYTDFALNFREDKYSNEELKDAVDQFWHDDPRAIYSEELQHWIAIIHETIHRTYLQKSESYTDTETILKQYKGFYIARYEAGTTSPRTTTSVAPKEFNSKKGLYPCNYVNYDEAKNLLQSYTSDTVSNLESEDGEMFLNFTIPYGTMWDAIMRFINDDVDIFDSTNYGNYATSAFSFKGEYLDSSSNSWLSNKTKKGDKEGILLTTGACTKNKVKNIYDLAGNLWEMTSEVDKSSNTRVVRGGQFTRDGLGMCVSSRYQDEEGMLTGFRPAGVIKLNRLLQ